MFPPWNPSVAGARGDPITGCSLRSFQAFEFYIHHECKFNHHNKNRALSTS
jgi:hypothetical protein